MPYGTKIPNKGGECESSKLDKKFVSECREHKILLQLKKNPLQAQRRHQDILCANSAKEIYITCGQNATFLNTANFCAYNYNWTLM